MHACAFCKLYFNEIMAKIRDFFSQPATSPKLQVQTPIYAVFLGISPVSGEYFASAEREPAGGHPARSFQVHIQVALEHAVIQLALFIRVPAEGALEFGV